MFQLEKVIVKDVLEIEALTLESHIISIEGQSGTGKSTLLRLLNNLDDPASGTIYYHKKQLSKVPPIELRKKVVMVPQSPVIFDGTIRENLNIGLTLSGKVHKKDDELKEMLGQLWLDKSLDKRASELSGGEMQRISLGRVLLMEQAKVYLLDEPSSDLDDETTDHIMNIFIDKAQQRNQQIIMVTHDKEVTEKYADETINMDQYSKYTHVRGDCK